jgi:hypothetical protein
VTLDDIAAWECRQRTERDLSDLTDVVQMLRELGWLARRLDPPLAKWRAFVCFENLPELDATLAVLLQRSAGETRAENRAICARLAKLYAVVRDALAAGPRQASDDILVWRYASGEIDGVTVCQVAGWRHAELLEQCRYRGLKPPTVGETDGQD